MLTELAEAGVDPLIASSSRAYSRWVAALTWKHNGTDWNDPANWKPPQVPTDGDSVIIPDNPSGYFAVYDAGTIGFEDLSVGRPGLIPGDGAIMSVAGSFQWTAAPLPTAAPSVSTGKVKSLADHRDPSWELPT